MPVLVGPQGCGKSTIFSKLFGVWFNDTLTLADMRDKSALEKLSGAWCLEIAELAGMAKADLEVVKAFITRQIDKCRVAYARAVTTLPRQCIIIGTSNQEDRLNTYRRADLLPFLPKRRVFVAHIPLI